MDNFEPIDLFGEGTSVVDDELGTENSQNECVDESCVESIETEDNNIDSSSVNDESYEDVKVSNDNDDCLGDSNENAVLNDKIDIVLESSEKLSGQINLLSELFNKRILRTEHEEKIIDNMHGELQKYKEDLYSQLVRPILLDIIEVRDSILRISSTYLAKQEGEQDIPNKIFSGYAFDLQDILEKNNIEIYRSDAQEEYVPVKHRVIKKIFTSNREEHGKICESLSCGYSYNNRVISPEKVTIYIFDENINSEKEEIKKSEVIENG